MNRKRDSLNETLKALGATVKSAHNLAPFAVVVGGMVAVAVICITLLWAPLMIGTASLLVMLVSLWIFACRGNFGEALLSLVGGLLTIFAFEWTPARYVAFMAAWIGFAFAALLISSIKLAAKSEDIYRMAALRLAVHADDAEAIEKRLREIGETSNLLMLGPIERAEIIRVLAFRNLQLELIGPCLKGVETLAVITKCDTKVIANFLADFVISLGASNSSDAEAWVDKLYDSMKKSPVPPEDYFVAFQSSRRLLVSKSIGPIAYLDQLTLALADGFAPSDVLEAMERDRIPKSARGTDKLGSSIDRTPPDMNRDGSADL